MTKHQLLKHLDHRLSPARSNHEQALQKLVTFLGREDLVEVAYLFKP